MNAAEPLDRLLQEAASARDAARGDEAEALYRQAVRQHPGEAEPHHHLGALYERAGRLEAAEAEFRQALALAPAAVATQRVLGNLLLSQGRYAEGFALFEARHALPQMAKPPLPFPEWRGEDVSAKRLLIWPEQGFGDQIQFARFAPILKSRGAAVTLLCHAALARLFDGCLGVEVTAAAGAVEFPDPDHWVMTCSLAWRMGVTVETIPSAPYLHGLSEAAAPVGARMGIVARGNPGNTNDANRSLGPSDARRLASIAPGIIDLDPRVTGAKDFADTAAIIEQLDLVICVDTAVAHLAGAMGKPCWVLIPRVGTDWRWGRQGSDTPWYPSMRLYRQQTAGDWGSVLDRIEQDLSARL